MSNLRPLLPVEMLPATELPAIAVPARLRSATLLSAGLLALLLTACGTSGTSSTGNTSLKDSLYFASTNLPVAYVAESYTSELQVSGGVGPYSVRVASGKLPDGLVLNGRTLSGKATKAGLFSFTVEASDATLSTKAQPMSLTVTALPPLSLAVTLPTSEIRGETRLPLVVTAPRGMRAFRMQWALPEGVTVTRIDPVDTRAVAYWKVNAGLLTLDMGFRTAVATGDRLALLSVKPSKAVTLQAPRMGYNAVGADGSSIQTVALPAAPTPPALTPPAAQPAAPAAQPATQPAAQPVTQPATQPAGTPVSPASTDKTAPADTAPVSPVQPAPGGGK